MTVVKLEDIIYVLENHLDTPEAAGIVLDLFDYILILEDNRN